MDQLPKVGDPVYAIPTPAAIVELEAMEHNLSTVASMADRKHIRLRPHAKAHKLAEVAARQLSYGAVGICCQTVAEAESFVRSGIRDVLLTNQVNDSEKAGRLAHLARDRKTRIGTCVDATAQVGILAAAANKTKTRLDVYVEVNVGGNRCGVETPEEAIALATLTNKDRWLRFRGLQAYNGSAQHVSSILLRRDTIDFTARRTRAFVSELESRGISCAVVTGGGTGSLELDTHHDYLGEVQCGSYALMDASYLAIEAGNGEPMQNLLRPALFILSSVVSNSRPGNVVVDAGLKAMSFDSGMPAVFQKPTLRYVDASDEHGVLTCESGTPRPELATMIRLIPSHCDPTVALHDKVYAVANERIAAIWMVQARGSW